MARIFIDGFEGGSMDTWNGGKAGSPSISTLTGKTGSYCLLTQSGANYLTLILPTTKSSLYMSFKTYFANPNFYNWPDMLRFEASSGTVLGRLMFRSTQRISANHSTNTWIADSSVNPEPTGVWASVEIYYLPHVSAGSFIMKRNGVTVINATGIQTAPSTTDIGRVVIGPNIGGGLDTYWDDVVIDDANWIGSTFIQGVFPTGAGATAGWTPSTGSNYDTVNEAPPSDADYVSTTSGQTDTYAMGNLTGTIQSIKAVAVQSRNWREGNGTFDRGQHIVRPASTDRLATAKTGMFEISTPKEYQSIWELNPEDSQAWEEADVNGMEAGIKCVEA